MFSPETVGTLHPDTLKRAKESFDKATGDSARHRSPYPTIPEKEKAERIQEEIRKLNEAAAKPHP